MRTRRREAEHGSAVHLAALRGREGKSGWDPENRRGWLDVAGNCEAPIHIERWARPLHRPELHPVIGMLHHPVASGGHLDLKVRCKKCFECRKANLMEWLARFHQEWKAADRSWFCTFTFNPQWVKKHENNLEFLMAKEMKNFLKRLRIGRKRKCIYRGREVSIDPVENLRYFATMEKGAQHGRLHWHAILHGDLRWVQIHYAWHAGFIHARLIPRPDSRSEADKAAVQAAFYTLKYVTKSNQRLRASLHYGTPPHGDAGESPTSALRRASASPAPQDATTPRGAVTSPALGEPSSPARGEPPHPFDRNAIIWAELERARQYGPPLPEGDDIPF